MALRNQRRWLFNYSLSRVNDKWPQNGFNLKYKVPGGTQCSNLPATCICRVLSKNRIDCELGGHKLIKILQALQC